MNDSSITTAEGSVGYNFKKYAGINAVAVLLISTLVLLGWSYDIDPLRQPIPGQNSMNPTTALTFIFSAAGILWLLLSKRSESIIILPKILSTIIFSIGVITLLRYFNVFNSNIDQWLLTDKLDLNRFNNKPILMAPNTAFSFILTGIALFLLDRRTVLPQYLSLLIALIAFLSLNGYMHQVPEFYGTVYSPMSAPTAVCFLLLASAILFGERKRGFMAIITSMDSGGRVARLLLPMCIVVPILIDLLRLYGEKLGLYSNAYGIALCSTFIILIFIYVTWKAITFINKINYSLTTEIAERKLTEEELKRTNLFLDTILDNIPLMIFVKKGAELRYVNVNKAGEDIMGMKEEFMVGKNDYELFPKHIADFFRKKDLEVLNSKDLLLIEEEPIVKGDEELWLSTKKIAITDDEGEPLYMLGISEDITEKRLQANKIKQFYAELEQKVKERTEELSLSEQRFRALIENSSDSISMIDASARVIYQSPAVERMTGFSVEDKKNTTVFNYVHPEDQEAVNQIYIKLMEQPGEAFPVQYRMLTRKGDYVWIEGTVVNMLHDESVRAFVTNYRNVTERKMHEQEMETLISELTQNNKDLQQFSYITSHNLRAPVVNLVGLVSIADEISIADPDLAKIFKDIGTSTKLLNNTINDLVEVVNIKNSPSINMEEIPLNPMFEKVISQVSLLMAQHHPEIHFDFKAAPVIYFNKAYLESIFLNLLTNSLKYRSPERPLKINIQSEVNVDEWIIRFTDNGLGIDLNRYKDRIFGLYQRFHQTQDGKGLGLYLVKSQMEALNAKIEVESEAGKGTTFILKFKKKNKQA